MPSDRSSLRTIPFTLAVACLTLTAACAGTPETDSAVVVAVPVWTWDSTMVFPADRSLARPEDGVALPDGRLLVADQAHGLRLVETDGRSAPFGNMAAAGYSHSADRHGGANGVALEPDGAHVLVADIFQGTIYRVHVTTGAAELLFRHRYGVNTAVRDSRGALWFTQSAHNTPELGEARMWAAIDPPAPEGALLRVPMVDGRLAAESEVLVDSLYFANGLAIDEAAGRLYVSEITGGRVLRFDVDLASGALSNRTVFVDSLWADNIELDGAGNLWIAVPVNNELVVVNTATGERHTAFRAHTPEQRETARQLVERGRTGGKPLELFTPALWAPLPGAVTGVILPPAGGGPVYLTTLGDALVKLP